MKLGAVMIVKNEESWVGVTIQAARRAGAEVLTVIDTGSTDGTIDAIRRECDGIRLNLTSMEWVNFGACRSRAFALAQGTADWLLALDADMTVEIDQDFVPDPTVDAYLIDIGHPGWENWLPLLLNGHRAWKSVGAVHEYTVMADGTVGRREPTDRVRVTMHGGDRSSPAKTRWHAKLLRAELARNPDDARATFYLAQSARELGHTATARRLYQRRAAMGGFEEERWYAQYRAALLGPWEPLALLTAWEARPHRPEPLYALLRGLNERGLHHAAYALAGALVPVHAVADVLFVETWIADWGLAYERSIAAWWVHSMAEFDQLTAQLLANPRLPKHIRAQVERNGEMERAA